MISPSLHLLFVCSRNRWRSPTAEKLLGRRPGLLARSAGLSASARRRISSRDLAWADAIFVMEDEHRERLLDQFGEHVEKTPVFVLDIPDEFGFMDATLVEMLEAAVEPHLRSMLEEAEL